MSLLDAQSEGPMKYTMFICPEFSVEPLVESPQFFA